MRDRNIIALMIVGLFSAMFLGIGYINSLPVDYRVKNIKLINWEYVISFEQEYPIITIEAEFLTRVKIDRIVCYYEGGSARKDIVEVRAWKNDLITVDIELSRQIKIEDIKSFVFYYGPIEVDRFNLRNEG